jgi:competence protein ComEA
MSEGKTGPHKGVVYAGFLLAGIALASAFFYLLPGRETGRLSEKAAEAAYETLPDEPPPSAPPETVAEDMGETLVLPEPPPEPEAPEVFIGVSVMGAVRNPGFYEMAAGSRVQDLLDRADGVTETADLSDINIAAKLVDATTLTIPKREVTENDGHTFRVRRQPEAADLNPPFYTRSGWRPETGTLLTEPASSTLSQGNAPADPPPGAAPGLLDLNTATMDELETLPGIGPKTAEKIIARRALEPFVTVEDLDKVHGIGPRKLEAVRALVCVR